MVQDTPSRKLDQYIVRFPDGMRDRLKEAAANNNRSLNAEIISRLEESLIDTNQVSIDLSKERAEIRRVIKDLDSLTRIIGGAIDAAADGNSSELNELVEMAKETPALKHKKND